MQRALEFETRRQSRILEDGGAVQQATMGWDDGGQKTYLMRTKEGEADYRYFPEPDLPPLHITEAWLEAVAFQDAGTAGGQRARYVALGVRAYDADIIAYDVGLAEFFGVALEAYEGEPQTLANWLNGDVTGLLNAEGRSLQASSLTPEHLVTLVSLVDAGTISGKTAKDLLPEVMAGSEPKSLVEARGLGQLTDSSAVAKIVDEVMRDNPALVESVADNPKAVNALLVG